jgi:hypothetical protein
MSFWAFFFLVGSGLGFLANDLCLVKNGDRLLSSSFNPKSLFLVRFADNKPQHRGSGRKDAVLPYDTTSALG